MIDPEFLSKALAVIFLALIVCVACAVGCLFMVLKVRDLTRRRD